MSNELKGDRAHGSKKSFRQGAKFASTDVTLEKVLPRNGNELFSIRKHVSHDSESSSEDEITEMLIPPTRSNSEVVKVEKKASLRHSGSTEEEATEPRKVLMELKEELKEIESGSVHEKGHVLLECHMCSVSPERTAWWKKRKSYSWDPRMTEEVRTLHGSETVDVLLVQHMKTKKIAAMKIISKEQQDYPNLLRKMKTERLVFEMVKGHPLMLQLFSYMETMGRYCFVMEYLSGGSLASHVRHLRLSEKQIRSIAAQLVQGIHYLHKKGIIHGDIEPEHILYMDSDHIKLTGFGSAIIGEEGQEPYGTPLYLAPEVFTIRHYEYSADWWSLGVIMFEALVGKTPVQVYLENVGQWQSASLTVDNFRQALMSSASVIPEWLAPETKSILRDFLKIHPRRRLGGSKYSEIKTQPFFKGIQFKY